MCISERTMYVGLWTPRVIILMSATQMPFDAYDYRSTTPEMASLLVKNGKFIESRGIFNVLSAHAHHRANL